MQSINEGPWRATNFVVDLGRKLGESADDKHGFSEVIFHDFRYRDDPAANNRVILKRGAPGSRELYEWWHAGRDEHGGQTKAQTRRTVTVSLLADDLVSTVLTWRFHNARPVALSYSSLNALGGSGVLMESLELSFDSVSME